MKKAHARFAIKRLYSERLKNMVVYKCKECGGEIEPQENGLGKCLYCGAVQTLPKEKDDKIQNLLNRANDFRLNCDFDRAIFEYEEVLKLSEAEPEAHWGLFLSKYGVEYVKDNMTFTYKPTLHRISSISVFDDVDYQATIKYADSISAIQYKKDAENIETVMKELLLLSANQEPYDVFLSYKELDDTTRQRTDDSYLAHDLYNELTAQGYKVFFAPKSLGVGLYEPKIYSAIISSKVMIVLGTKPQYFDAVWVKNEWSRFAELIDNGEQKVLVPVFKNMEAGQLPNRLAKYQAYDMANISFLPSLLDVISQYVNKQSRVKFNKDASAEEAFLERGFLALEDKEFAQAESFFENVLNLNPHNSQAYFGKLMVEMKITKREQILTSPKYLSEYKNFEKAVRFADQQLKPMLLRYEKRVRQAINEQILNKRKALNEQIFNTQKKALASVESVFELEGIIDALKPIANYKNVSQYINYLLKCNDFLEQLNKHKAEINDKKLQYEEKIKSKTSSWLFCFYPELFSLILACVGVIVGIILEFVGMHIENIAFDLFETIILAIMGGAIGFAIGYVIDVILQFGLEFQSRREIEVLQSHINALNEKLQKNEIDTLRILGDIHACSVKIPDIETGE